MIIIYNIFFSLVLLLLKKKRGHFDIACYIVLIYFICSLCGTYVYYVYPDAIIYPKRITLESITVHILLLSLFIWPFIKYSKKINIESFDRNERAMKIFSWCIIIPSFLSIIISVFDVLLIFAFGDFSAARDAFASGDLDTGYTTRYGILGYLFAFGPQVCFLAVTMAFYWVFCKNRKILGLCLFIASFALVMQNLAIAGREGIVRWIFYFGFNIILFRNYLSYRNHEKFWQLVVLGICVLLFFFLSISTDRFDDSEYGTMFTVFNYAGQPFYYFSYGYKSFAFSSIYGLEYFFPIINTEQIVTIGLNDYVLADYHLNTFPTFVGSFVNSGGLINTFIYCIFWIILCNLWFNRKGKLFGFSTFVGFVFLYDITLIGVLYYIHYSRFTHISIIVYSVLVYLLSRYKKRVVL